MQTWRNLSSWALSLGRFSPWQARTFILELMVALSLAFLVWIYTRSREQASIDQVDVPVLITLASGTAGNYELELNGSSRIPMSFTGPPSRMRELRRMLQRGSLQVRIQVSVPEEHQKDSTYHDLVSVEPGSVPVPPGVITVIADGYNGIPYTLHRLEEKMLPVRLDYAGDVSIKEMKIEPATVRVRGPKAILDRSQEIPTQSYKIPEPTEQSADGMQIIQGKVSLVRELEGRSIKTTPDSVGFRFRLIPRQKTYVLKDVPVQFLCPPDFAWTARFANAQAAKVTLKVAGPASDELPSVLAFVDLTRTSNLGTGRNIEPLRIQLPRDYRLVGDLPRPVAFYLDPIQWTPIH